MAMLKSCNAVQVPGYFAIPRPERAVVVAADREWRVRQDISRDVLEVTDCWCFVT